MTEPAAGTAAQPAALQTSAPAGGPVLNPFPGLRPFREDEEYLFFGREPQSDALVNKLAATHLLAVVGTSGSGKSSLVNCGLRPALHRGLMTQAGSAWRMASLRPGIAPIGELAQALAVPGVLFPEIDTGEFSQAELIESTLRMSKLGLIDAFNQARLPAGTNLLIVVDQFEELFRYRSLAAGGPASQSRVLEEATAFINLLLEVDDHPQLPIYVVLTMRSDFLGDCAQFFGLPEAINRGQYLVPRMTREERRLAIAGPVGVAGAELDPVLLTRLVNDVGDNPDQLSQLQHAMNRTWDAWSDELPAPPAPRPPIGLRHYEAIGTIAHALNQHAEEAWSTLTGERSRMLCETIFRAITDRRIDARGTRRPTRFDTLCAIAEAQPVELIEVIEVFRDPRCAFLMPPAGEPIEDDTVIDISHESLMRVWTRLRQWGEDEAQSARLLRRVAKTAELHAAGQANLLRNPELQVALDWRRQEKPNAAWAERYYSGGLDTAMALIDTSLATFERERDEAAQRSAEQAALQSQIRRTRRLRLAALVATVAVSVVAIVFAFLFQRALEAERVAKRERSEARASEAVALRAKAEAEEAVVRARRWADQRDEAQSRLDEAIRVVPGLAKAIDARPPGQAIVYLQTPAGQGRDQALALQKQLQQAGYQAPGIESVSVSPRAFELRYFREEEKSAAQKLAEEIRLWKLGEPRVVLVRGFETRSRLQQFEVWFPLIAGSAADTLVTLIGQIDSAAADERKAALAILVRDYRTSASAVAQVVALYAADRVNALSPNGRVNGLYFLASTSPEAWSRDSVRAARDALTRVSQAGAGPDTRAQLEKLGALLDSVKAPAR
jgi:hypothetical protein